MKGRDRKSKDGRKDNDSKNRGKKFKNSYSPFIFRYTRENSVQKIRIACYERGTIEYIILHMKNIFIVN